MEERAVSSKTVKATIIVKHDTTARWNAAVGFIPAEGEIIVYTDYQKKEVNGETILIPGIKIGTGNAYVQDLSFVGAAESARLLEHVADTAIHVTPADRAFWNNKLNVTDNQEVVDDTLVFNRN